MGIIFKPLHADAARSARDLQPGNDAHPPRRKPGRLLTLPIRALLQLMQQRPERDLLRRRVHVQHAVEASRQDTLELEQHDLGLERAHAVDGPLRAAEHEAGEDVLLLDAAQPHAHLVAAGGAGDLVLGLAVEGADLDGLAVRHHEVGGALFDDAGLDLALDHGAHVAVFGGDGHHEGRVDLAFEGLHRVEELEECGAIVPGSDVLRYSIFDAYRGLCADGHDGNVCFGVVADSFQESG